MTQYTPLLLGDEGGREARRVGQALLERHQPQQRRKRARHAPTHVVVEVAETPKDWEDQQHNVWQHREAQTTRQVEESFGNALDMREKY
jgi:hypothetical protein